MVWWLSIELSINLEQKMFSFADLSRVANELGRRVAKNKRAPTLLERVCFPHLLV